MLNEKLLDVLSHQGVVTIVTYGDDAAHASNTWNHYVRVAEDDRLLIPAAGMRKTQTNIERQPDVLLTVASPEVQGFYGMGAGFLLEGTAAFKDSGPDFEMMKEKFPFLTRVLSVKINGSRQTT